MSKKLLAILLAFSLFSLAGGVSAAETFVGGATTSNGHVVLVSDSTDPFSVVRFDDANGMQVSDLTALSADFNVTDDDCFGGSPRFQVAVDTDGDNVSDGNVFIYMGPTPSFTGCAQDTWVNTSNLVGSTEARFDLTQFGGAFYSTYADMVALLGDDTILGISLVADAGWGFTDGEQTVLVDNVVINGTTYDFAPLPQSKDECKKGGWMNFTNPAFKNQGQCVSFFNHQN